MSVRHLSLTLLILSSSIWNMACISSPEAERCQGVELDETWKSAELAGLIVEGAKVCTVSQPEPGHSQATVWMEGSAFRSTMTLVGKAQAMKTPSGEYTWTRTQDDWYPNGKIESHSSTTFKNAQHQLHINVEQVKDEGLAGLLGKESVLVTYTFKPL